MPISRVKKSIVIAGVVLSCVAFLWGLLLSNPYLALSLGIAHAYLGSESMYNPTTGEKAECNRELDAPQMQRETPAMKACVDDYLSKGFVHGFGPETKGSN
jgi:hypothetical protein